VSETDVPFIKMEGLGNDYIYVVLDRPDGRDWPRLARRMSDRHFGVGADGLIQILPSHTYDARMVMYNADGSEGEMCGNGIRCIAKYLHDTGRIREKAVIETRAGPIGVEVVAENPTRVRVDMGAPRLRPDEIPTLLREGPDSLEGLDIEGWAVSMGNPHFISFWRADEELPVARLGPRIERHPAFPERTNVEFAQILDEEHIRLRVWERGTGETMACGTGASATLVAAHLAGLTGERAVISLPGGDLEVEWRDHVFLTGPAREAFRGTYIDDGR